MSNTCLIKKRYLLHNVSLDTIKPVSTKCIYNGTSVKHKFSKYNIQYIHNIFLKAVSNKIATTSY